MSTILKADPNLKALVKENVIFVLDRGFQDCVR
jgi:hypothetical protein